MKTNAAFLNGTKGRANRSAIFGKALFLPLKAHWEKKGVRQGGAPARCYCACFHPQDGFLLAWLKPVLLKQKP